MDESDIKIFQAENGKTEIQVIVQSETVWLSQKQMADLFEKDSDTIGLHLRNIYKSGELIEKATTEKSSVVQKEGKRNVTRTIKVSCLSCFLHDFEPSIEISGQGQTLTTSPLLIN